MTPHLFFVVPVFNEEGNLKRLFESFRDIVAEFGDKYSVQILLVDDGSTDGTVDLARQLAVNLCLDILQLPVNMGPGKAFAWAFEYLSTRCKDSDLVVTMEGDNTSRLDLLWQMLHRLEEGFDVIFASPYLYGGGIENTSNWRVFLSAMANLFVKEMLGIHGIMTVSSFFRLYRGALLKRLQSVFGAGIIERNGFECMIEMTMKMVYLGAKISEIAMVLDTSLRVGKSRMRIGRTVVGYLTLWWLKRKWFETRVPHKAHLGI
jgi:dolichol-phosphate mannosyltransferase